MSFYSIREEINPPLSYHVEVKMNTTLNSFLTDEDWKKPSGVFVTHDKMTSCLKPGLLNGPHGVFLGSVGLERNDIELHVYSSSEHEDYKESKRRKERNGGQSFESNLDHIPSPHHIVTIDLGRKLIHQRRSLQPHAIVDPTANNIDEQLHLLLIQLKASRQH